MADIRHLAVELNLIMSLKLGNGDGYQMKGLIEIFIKTYVYALLNKK